MSFNGSVSPPKFSKERILVQVWETSITHKITIFEYLIWVNFDVMPKTSKSSFDSFWKLYWKY